MTNTQTKEEIKFSITIDGKEHEYTIKAEISEHKVTDYSRIVGAIADIVNDLLAPKMGINPKQ